MKPLLLALLLAPSARAAAPDGVPAIVWAAYNGDAAGVRSQLDAGADVDAAVTRQGALPPPCEDKDLHNPDNGATALLWAAAKNEPDVVNLLLARRAQLDKRDGQGYAPIHAAACNASAGALAVIADALAGASVDVRTGWPQGRFETHNLHGRHYQNTPLHLAALGDPARFDDFAKVAGLLLDRGADPDAVDEMGFSPLHLAARACNARMVDLLLHRGPRLASAGVVDQYGARPIDRARDSKCDAALGPALDPDPRTAAARLKSELKTDELAAAARAWQKADPGAVAAPAPAAAGAASPTAGSQAKGGADLALPEPPAPGGTIAGLDVQTLMAVAADPKLAPVKRLEALHLLNLKHDPGLVPFFAASLKDPASADEAAVAMASVLDKLKADAPGADWSAFNALAPSVIGPLGRMPEGSAANELYRKLVGRITLMPPDAQDAFVKGFSDVDLLLMLGYNTADQVINERQGLHSDAARKIFAEVQARVKSRGGSLGALLDGPELSALPQTRVRVITQLFKYDFMGGALAAEPSLATGMPARLFPAVYQKGAMGTFEAYGVGDLVMARADQAGPFAQSVLSGVRAGAVDPAKGLLFLKFHEKQLSPAQAAELESLWPQPQYVPAWISARYAERERAAQGSPVVYGSWPSGPMRVLLVMTQADKAGEFIAALGGKKSATSVDFKTESGKRVRIDFQIFGSDKEGWTGDRDGVTSALIAGLDSPGYQAVFYRGHVGDYNSGLVASKAAPITRSSATSAATATSPRKRPSRAARPARISAPRSSPKPSAPTDSCRCCSTRSRAGRATTR